MPFTFSHPALILPLTKAPHNWFSATGLVAGSMAPDFEYFIRMGMYGDIGHTTAGLFWFDLPVGLALAFLFHNVIRNRLYDNLPQIVKLRILKYKSFTWNDYFKEHWWVVIGSVLLGAVSHFLWDGFTHADGYFVNIVPALKESMTVMGMPLPFYRMLQHISTVAGALAIAFAIHGMPAAPSTPNQSRTAYWPLVFAIAAIVVVLRMSLVRIGPDLFIQIVVVCISGLLIGLSAVPLIVKEKNI